MGTWGLGDMGRDMGTWGLGDMVLLDHIPKNQHTFRVRHGGHGGIGLRGHGGTWGLGDMGTWDHIPKDMGTWGHGITHKCTLVDFDMTTGVGQATANLAWESQGYSKPHDILPPPRMPVS